MPTSANADRIELLDSDMKLHMGKEQANTMSVGNRWIPRKLTGQYAAPSFSLNDTYRQSSSCRPPQWDMQLTVSRTDQNSMAATIAKIKNDAIPTFRSQIAYSTGGATLQ